MTILNDIQKYLIFKFKSLIGVYQIRDEIRKLSEVSIERFLSKNLHENPKYQDPKRLNRYEFQIYSQNGEDGIVKEIFRRIGTTNKTFVEFGVGDGLENNTAHLLLNDWKGFWLECSGKHAARMNDRLKSLIDRRLLVIKNTLVTAENIEPLFNELAVPKEFDFLSIDIDGNDYWVWKNILNYKPRVVAIEYNAFAGPYIDWTIKYDPAFAKKDDRYWGASLKLLERLGKEKGYTLVGCNFSGVNAFFVREDLVKSDFFEPFTSENHFESLKPYLARHVYHPKSYEELSNIQLYNVKTGQR
jgi:hypothetical protein